MVLISTTQAPICASSLANSPSHSGQSSESGDPGHSQDSCSRPIESMFHFTVKGRINFPRPSQMQIHICRPPSGTSYSGCMPSTCSRESTPTLSCYVRLSIRGHRRASAPCRGSSPLPPSSPPPVSLSVSKNEVLFGSVFHSCFRPCSSRT